VENGAVIRCRLDLLIRLTDTTTGLAVDSTGAVFKRGKDQLPARNRGDGNYIMIDTGRENFLMQLSVPGYDQQEVEINYEALDERMPFIDVFLIPSENTDAVLTLTGKKRGLVAVSAVQLGKPVCSISEFVPKEKRMTLFLPNRQMNMEGGHYGLLHGEKDFEEFVVEEQIDAKAVKLQELLQEEFTVNSPIARVIFGRTDKKGNFTLRVRNTAEHLRYLVRFTYAEAEPKYKVFAFDDGEVVEEK
jgi:hypothetical protein